MVLVIKIEQEINGHATPSELVFPPHLGANHWLIDCDHLARGSCHRRGKPHASVFPLLDHRAVSPHQYRRPRVDHNRDHRVDRKGMVGTSQTCERI